MNFKVITIANRRPFESYYTFDQFFKSLDVEPLVLSNGYGGLGSKPRILYNAIKEGLITEKYIIFSDCFDVVFQFPIRYLLLKYFQFDSPLVISCEKNCFPDNYKSEYDNWNGSYGTYKYLNSGMIVGETEAMLSLLGHIDAKNIPDDYWSQEKNCMINPNDQEYYQRAFLEQPVKIKLDYDQILCNTLHSVIIDDLDFSTNGKVWNKETKTFPCAFHFNGNAKTNGLREPILKQLNLL